MKTALLALLVMAPFRLPQRESSMVTGRLLSADGKAAAGVRVMAVAVNAPEVLSAITETDATGAYRLENLAPGRYRIRAGLLNSPTDYPGEITVTRGSVQTGVDFMLVGVKLSGRVILDPRQKPLPRFRRVALARDALVVAEVQTDETGAFEFLGVPPGTYSVGMRGAAVVNRSELRGIQVGDKDITGIQVRAPLLEEVKVRMVVERNGPLPTRPVGVTFVNSDGTPRTQLIGDTPAMVLFGENTYRVATSDVPGYTVTSIMRGSLDLTQDQLKLPSDDTSDIVVTIRPQP
jgi:hypothetical protein